MSTTLTMPKLEMSMQEGTLAEWVVPDGGDVKEGDLIEVDFVPGTGTTVTIAGKAKGTIEGDDFAKATQRIWLGPKPPSDDPKYKAAVVGLIGPFPRAGK